MSAELLIYTTRRLDEFVIRELTSENHVLAIPESGSISFNDGNGDIIVNPLEAVFFEKGKFYKRSAVTPFYIHYFRFSCSRPIFTEHHIKFKDTARIKSTLTMLNSLTENISIHNDFEFKSSLFLDIINQYRMENQSRILSTSVKDAAIEDAIDYLKKNLHIAINLTRLSNAAGISYVHFIRRFKAYTGVSPSQYLTGLRLNRAVGMLTDTALPIKEISALCGFENEYYFSNFFKKHHGISPSKYRKCIERS